MSRTKHIQFITTHLSDTTKDERLILLSLIIQTIGRSCILESTEGSIIDYNLISDNLLQDIYNQIFTIVETNKITL
jgi:hypothetical protein